MSLAVGLLWFAASAILAQQAKPSAAGRYTDLVAALQNDDDINTWYGIANALRRDFDMICGDTFCEGDYSNIAALRFACAADAATGEIGQCAWSFAASDERIDARRGRVHAAIPVWRCVSPLAPHTTVRELLSALAAAHPLHAPLPRTGATLYDGLSDCL
ncbi:hypothetical protein IHE49_16845 [Rhodanobacter sp. 7MK24]|uniref:hypothetical protein n=1 Tax=Rhodanobacter sp. 7MK24 TaxID=2775922 RepID=UPI00177EFF53|nr:hypothetical protein [Rhodanobacter sp. 7MK24]MBD8882152.1 hypothetical protein [Rhodanobacter sp. 7MK24]